MLCCKINNVNAVFEGFGFFRFENLIIQLKASGVGVLFIADIFQDGKYLDCSKWYLVVSLYIRCVHAVLHEMESVHKIHFNWFGHLSMHLFEMD